MKIPSTLKRDVPRLLSKVSAIAAVLGVCATPGAFASPSSPTAEIERTITVEVKRISPQPVQNIILLPGRTETPTSTVVAADIDGFITSCTAFLGAQVKRNATLCALRSNDPGFTDRSIPVTAPVEGAVSELLVAPGSTVTRGTALARIVPKGSERFVVHIPFSQSRTILLGQKGQIETLDGRPVTTEAKPGGLAVRCVAKAPTADSATSTVRTEWVAEGDGQLALLQLARIRIVTAERNVTRVPQRSLRYDSGQPYVRIVKDNTITHAPVTLGPSDGEFVEVLTGVNTGDLVVTRSSGFVKPGDLVTVDDGPQAPQAKN